MKSRGKSWQNIFFSTELRFMNFNNEVAGVCTRFSSAYAQLCADLYNDSFSRFLPAS